MAEMRKIAAILVADVVGYSRLAGADEDRTLSRLRGLRSDLIDPAIDAHHGRIVKRTGDGALIEFRSVIEAVGCAVEVQNGMAERNAGVPPERRIDFRIGVHLGDVVEEADGDLMGDGVNVAARLEGVCEPGGVCLSEQAYLLVKGRSDVAFRDRGPIQLKNIADPVRVFSLQIGPPPQAKPAVAPKRRGGSKRRSLVLAGAGIAAALVMTPVGEWLDWRPWSTPKPDVSGAALRDKLATAPRLSIVVLPFESLNGDPDPQHFGDAFADDLTTDLSQLKGSFVVGRDAALAYKEKPVDARKIGAELGVRYILEGSVRRAAESAEVSAQLISTETGAQAWADRFEGEAAQVGQLHKELAARLAHWLGADLVRTESPPTTRKRPAAPPPSDKDERANRSAPAPQRQRLAASPPLPQAKLPEPQPVFCGSPASCWRNGGVYHPLTLDFASALQQQRQTASPPPPQAKPPEPQPANCGSPLACWRSGGVNY
jgi:adenylate cyclase